MRHLLNIRQTHDVLEYANRFEQAKHRVLVHNRDIDEVFFVQKFLNGLRYNISNAITLHKPRTVDAALSLALMQEELLEASQKMYQPKFTKESSRFSPKIHQPQVASVLGTPPAGISTATTPTRPVQNPDNRPKNGTTNCLLCRSKGRNWACV